MGKDSILQLGIVDINSTNLDKMLLGIININATSQGKVGHKNQFYSFFESVAGQKKGSFALDFQFQAQQRNQHKLGQGDSTLNEENAI